jgi:predicted Rossmann-fold nucleotide-binding protein
MNISKIISGGQTGADRGALDAAIHCKLDYGGWIPKGRKAEDGSIPVEYDKLTEMTSADYHKRTEANVADSDVTIVFTYGPTSGGSSRIICWLGWIQPNHFGPIPSNRIREKTWIPG